MPTVREEIGDLAVPIDSVRPHPRNARRGAVSRLVESLAENGQYRPIVVRRSSGEILAGNHTWKAAQRLGWTEIAATFVDCDDETATRILLADNRYGELGGYDNEALADLLRDVAATDDGLIGTGYTTTDLADLLAGIDTRDEAEGLTDPDAVPEGAPARTKPGDVWLLGEHRLICGDARDPDDHDALLAGETVALLLTDPPYGVDYEGKTADRLTIEGDDLDDDELYQLLVQSFTAATSRLREGGGAYVFNSEAAGAAFRRAFVDAGLLLKQILIWAKNVFVLGRQDYQWQHEPILYGWRPGAAHYWHGGRTRSTFFDDEVTIRSLKKAELVEILEEIRALSTVVREAKPTRNGVHPTMKPVRLIARIMSNSSLKGDVVLDPFGGSGSTLIAAHRTGRLAASSSMTGTTST